MYKNDKNVWDGCKMTRIDLEEEMVKMGYVLLSSSNHGDGTVRSHWILPDDCAPEWMKESLPSTWTTAVLVSRNEEMVGVYKTMYMYAGEFLVD